FRCKSVARALRRALAHAARIYLVSVNRPSVAPAHRPVLSHYTIPSGLQLRMLALCAILAGVWALSARPSRADDGTPPNDALMCLAPEDDNLLMPSESEQTSPIFDPSSLSLLPSPSLDPTVGGERSPFDDPDDGPPPSSVRPSGLEPVPIPDKPY